MNKLDPGGWAASATETAQESKRNRRKWHCSNYIEERPQFSQHRCRDWDLLRRQAWVAWEIPLLPQLVHGRRRSL
jgi:hypothetical protein